MKSALSWNAILRWVLPGSLLAVGFFPPHVHPTLLGPLCLAGLLLALALTGSGRLRRPGPGPRLALLTVCVLTLLSALGALQPMRSIRLILVWFTGALVFAAAGALHRSGGGRRLVWAIVVLGVTLSALGLYQSLVAFPDLTEGGHAALSGEGRRGEAIAARVRSGRAVATLGLPALLASLLILGAPLAAGEALESRGASRIAWGAAALVQAAGLAATRSLGGGIALVGGSLLALVHRRGGRRLRAAAALAVLAAALLAATAPRLTSAGEGSAAASLGYRAANWRAALSMMIAHPALGVGPGNYGIAFPVHRTWESNETQHAHNSYLEAVSDLGFAVVPLALLALVSLLTRVAGLCAAREEGDEGPGWRGAALSAAVLAWLIQNLFDFGAYVGASLIPFMALAGLAVAMAGEGRGAGSARAPATAGALSRALLLSAALACAIVAVPDSLCRGRLEAGRTHAADGDLRGAAEEARLAGMLNPFEPEAHGALAEALLGEAIALPPGGAVRRALLAEAAVQAEEAVRLDPHTAHRRATVAMVRAASGDGAGAYAAMAAASRLNPFRPAYRRERDALLGILTGRPPVEDPGRGSP